MQLSTTNHRLTVLTAVLALTVAAACGGGAEQRAEDSDTTTTSAPTTAAAPTTGASADTTTSTAPPATTTTAGQTTTTAAATTTTVGSTADNPRSTVDRKIAAGVAALPDGWNWTTQDGIGVVEGERDVVYGPCLGPDSFDIDDLDEVSEAAVQARFEAPPSTDNPLAAIIGTARGSLEARLFDSEDTAAEAFAVLKEIFGTQDGRQCMAQSLLASALADAPPGQEFDVSVEERIVEGGQVGVRIAAEFEFDEGLPASWTLDISAALDGACTVFATYQSFLEPFPSDVADASFSAAAGA